MAMSKMILIFLYPQNHIELSLDLLLLQTGRFRSDNNFAIQWAAKNGHELILVSAQRPHCEEPTTDWLQRWGFVGWDEMYYTKHKHLIDVDVLIDDSPEKLEKFADRSVNHGSAICYKQSWNQQCRDKGIAIDRLSDIMTRVFG